MAIEWLDQSHFGDAVRRSSELNRPVLLDFHDPTTLGCQRLDRVTYADRVVQSAIAENVIPLRVVTIDPDAASTALITRYISISTPTVQLISEDGTPYHWWRGAPRHTRPALGFRSVYNEMDGDLPPRAFLAQLWLGLCKAALLEKHHEKAQSLLNKALAVAPPGALPRTEVDYWAGTIDAKGSPAYAPSGTR